MERTAFKGVKPPFTVAVIGEADRERTALMAALAAIAGPDRQLPGVSRNVLGSGRGDGPDVRIPIDQAEVEAEDRKYNFFGWPQRGDFQRSVLFGNVRLDTLLVVVSAAQGLTRRTREQLVLGRQAGIDTATVLISKTGGVAAARREAVEHDVLKFLAECGFLPERTRVARDGPDARVPLVRELDALPAPTRAYHMPFLMMVTGVSSGKRGETMLHGRVARGAIRAGDAVQVIGSYGVQHAVVQRIETREGFVDDAQPDDHVGVLLRGPAEYDASPGDTLAKPDAYAASVTFDALVYVHDVGAAGAVGLLEYDDLHLRFPALDVRGVGAIQGAQGPIKSGDTVRIRIDVERPLVVFSGLRFTIGVGKTSVAVGMVTGTPRARRGRRGKLAFEGWRIQDIAPLAPLARIAKAFGVEFKLFGGAASRAAMFAYYQPKRTVDLFDLAPFSSDIDLEHSGDAKLTDEIVAAIENEIGFASWVRWSVIDAERGLATAAQRSVSTRAPLRAMQFSTTRQEIHPDALDDLGARRVSFVRNPQFQQSYGTVPDVEILGLLMSLSAVADMRRIAGEGRLADEGAAFQWINDRAFGDFMSSHEDNRLSGRLWRALAAQWAQAPDDPIVQALIAHARRAGLFEAVGADDDVFAYGAKTSLCLSRSMPGRGFRIREPTPVVLTGEEGERAFLDLMDRRIALEFRQEDRFQPESILDPAFEVVAFAPNVTIAPAMDLGEAGPFGSDGGQDFLELSWRHAGSVLNANGLTAVVLPTSSLGMRSDLSSIAVGGTFAPDRPWIRARIGERADRERLFREASAAVVIVQVKSHG